MRVLTALTLTTTTLVESSPPSVGQVLGVLAPSLMVFVPMVCVPAVLGGSLTALHREPGPQRSSTPAV